MRMLKKLSLVLALMLVFCATGVAENDLESINFKPDILNSLELDATGMMVSPQMRALFTILLALDIPDSTNFDVDLSQSSYVGRDGDVIYFYLHGESEDAVISYSPFLELAIYVGVPLNTPDSVVEEQLDPRCPDGWYKNDINDIYNILLELNSAINE